MLTSVRRPKLFAGRALRRLREDAGHTQAALARRIDVSPGYLNQIEHDQRPLSPRVLQRVCTEFGVAADRFGATEDLRVTQDLREALADPVFGGRPVDVSELQRAVEAAPELVRRFLLLHRSHREQGEELGERQPAATRPLAPYEEVRDWVQLRRNHFDRLDRAAEELADTLRLTSATLREQLAERLRTRHGFQTATDPSLLSEGVVWRLDRRDRRLILAESAAPESRIFWMAHLVGQLEQRRLLDDEVHAARLSSVEARLLARVGLGNYFAGALILPYRRLLETAQAVRYDIEILQARFGASFEQVCHRLSTMQRPSLPGIPFYFAKTDIAGNVLKRSSATRFQFSRLGGPCPLWNVYRTFATPGQILVQVARTPDDVAYLNIARTVGRGGGSHLARPRSVAVVLGCEIEHATKTVYATGLDLQTREGATPIGPGCRVCERASCRHRAVPPFAHELDVGTEERGVVPYRIKGDAPTAGR